MTRLIVKNLPKNITEEKLRSTFSEKGNVTDIQLKYTKDGVFRQFAFIGYQTDNEADAALKYFNNVCIQTSRVKVERCTPLGAQEKPKSWSKYSVDSSAYRRTHGIDKLEKDERAKESEKLKKMKKKNAMEEIFGEHKDDPEFTEFLEAHDKKRILWGNDISLTIKESVSSNKTDEIETTSDVNDNHLKDKKSTKIDAPSEKKDGIMKDSTDSERGDSNESEQDDLIGSEEEETSIEDSKNKTKLADKNISDLEYMKTLMNEKKINKVGKNSKSKTEDFDLFTIKIHGIPYKTKRQEIIKFFKPNKPYSVRLPTNVHGFCYAGFKTEKEFQKAMLKNKSFLKGKQVFFSDFTEKNKITKNNDKNQNSTDDIKKSTKWSKQEEALKTEEDISESGRIFFRNLAYSTTEDDLKKLFEQFGPVAEINLPIDVITRQIKAFGTVEFVMPEHAVKAFNELDGTILHGRLLHLIPGKGKDNEEDVEGIEGLSFKVKKNIKLKQSAQQSYNWNTLFLGANVVADILARQFGETKEKILDMHAGGSSAAVRLALGETQIVMEMKKFLEENDVRLDVFDSVSKKRSNTIILAKNLPAETTVAELKPLFSKYGPLGRIVLPPSGVTALIEFLNSSEARHAFKKLAYSKFKSLPLYLEWAPENTFKTSPDGVQIKIVDEENNEKKTDKEANVLEKKKDSEMKQDTKEISTNENGEDLEDDDDGDEPPEQETTLFLRNLNFKTREEAIREHFKHLGAIHTVQVAMKKDPENPKNRIALGYGFIQFKKKKTADRALKEMHFTRIENNQVELKRSDRTLKVDVRSARNAPAVTKQTGTKIIVRNIPFQAKVKEIRDIFQVFGNIKSVRLPKKPTTGEEQHRGFGFVDFFDKSSARKAFEALCQSTHLYGRRLVLEWAAADENNVEELRKRTAIAFGGTNSQAKKSRKSVFDSSNISDIKDEGEEEEF